MIEAPKLAVSQWFNTEIELNLEQLRGRPVLVHAFQMLCPGCVAHAIPQTQKAQAIFAQTDIQVLGLHTVFEHHEAMTPIALKAFLHEYGIKFPVGVDTPSPQGDIPLTMAAYGMRGTPTTILINRAGYVTNNLFGQIEDMALGSMIQSLLSENPVNSEDRDVARKDNPIGRCDSDGCQ